jgi:hypothetical protein
VAVAASRCRVAREQHGGLVRLRFLESARVAALFGADRSASVVAREGDDIKVCYSKRMIATRDVVLESLKNLPDDATFEDITQYVSLMAELEQDNSPAPWDVYPEVAERLRLSIAQSERGQTLERILAVN